MADHPSAGPDKPAVGDPAPPPVRRNPVPSLLQALMGDTQDPGYAEAAARRRSGHERPVRRRALIAWLVAGVLVIGALFGVAARVTEASAAGADTAHGRGLLADIDRAQDRAGELEGAAASLGEQVRASQTALGAAGPLQAMTRLEVAGALTPVTGPGLRVVIDSPPDDPGGGVILDRDIQLLVNGLWSAGAEAVAIGGVRLQPTSAIRKAGGAILVDNKPVFWPLTIDAIGAPDTMHVDFAGTTGFGRFNSFVSLYSIRFDVTAEADLQLPAGSTPDVRYASPAPTAAGPTR